MPDWTLYLPTILCGIWDSRFVYTHRICSTSFRSVVTWLTGRTYASTDCTAGVGETIKRKGRVPQACLGKSTSMLWPIDSFQNRVSADSITWPYRGLRSGVDQSRSSIFLKLSAGKLLVFTSSQAQVYFFKIDMKYVVFMCRTIKISISNWPRTGKFSQLLRAGKTVAFDFAHHGHALVTLYVFFLRLNFYALIGQNLTGEFMHKIYAASWILSTLTAEADRVLCQLVFVFRLAWCVRGFKSLKRYWPYLIAFRGCISNGKLFYT